MGKFGSLLFIDRENEETKFQRRTDAEGSEWNLPTNEKDFIYVVTASTDDVIDDKDADELVRGGVTPDSDDSSFPRVLSCLPPKKYFRCSGSLGQLVILLYRLLDGGKAFVYDKQDSLTILKMAQMKSADEEEKATPTIRYLEEFSEIFDNEIAMKLDESSAISSSQKSTTSLKTTTTTTTNPIREFYHSFLDQSKSCDIFQLLRHLLDIFTTSSSSSTAWSSLSRLPTILLRRFVIVIDSKDLPSMLTSDFARIATKTLIGSAENIFHCRRNGSSSKLTRAEAVSLMITKTSSLSRLASNGRGSKKEVRENKDSSSSVGGRTPARLMNPSTAPTTSSLSPATPSPSSSRRRPATPRCANRTPRDNRTPRNSIGRDIHSQGMSKQQQQSPRAPFRSPLLASFSSPVSSTETHARHVILAYLRLVLNSRDELALAQCVDTPRRGLDADAFTDLRREAEAKGLPMFQCASSFVIRLKLGGKGYQAGEDSPLNRHAKGLEQLVDLVQKCQNVIEEGDADAGKSVEKVVNVLKGAIVKARDNRLRITSVEKAAKSVRELISLQWTRLKLVEEFVASQKVIDEEEVKVKKKFGAQGSNTKKLLQFILDEEIGATLDADEDSLGSVLSDAYSSSATPIRFPSLWSQFQSPSLDASFSSTSISAPRESSSNDSRRKRRNSPLSTRLSPNDDKLVEVEKGRSWTAASMAVKSSITWATTDSPPCQRLARRDVDDDVSSKDVANSTSTALDEDDDAVSTQDVAGPTVIMRRVKKRKLGLEGGWSEENSSSPDIGGGGRKRAKETASSYSKPVDENEDGNASKKLKLNGRKNTTTMPTKPKARRKIIPQLNGQQKLSGFFK